MDSSTIEVFVNGKLVIVRYIGVQPPNTYSLKEAATAKNKEWVEGQSVVLIRDISSVDEQGRLLRYVLVGSLEGTFINYELVRQGYTQTVRIAPDLACAETLGQAQMQAAQDEVGIWSPELMASPTPRPTHAPGWMSLPEGAKVKDTPRWCSPLCR
jgi:endonuclease YncB( thermonuclease family)